MQLCCMKCPVQYVQVIYSQVLHMKKSVQGSNREAINTPVESPNKSSTVLKYA